MNSTDPSTTGPLLCPFDSRRTSAEFVSKFIVVHLTTITAFCHLLSIRNEKILTWRPFFYAFTPFNILVQHILALLTIFTNYVLFRYFPKSKVVSVPNLHTSFSWLLGRAFKEDSRYSRIPTSNPTPWRPGSPNNLSQSSESSNEGGGKQIGRSVLALAFLAQCISSIFLYCRRVQYSLDAITIVDQRVFELACGGLLVAVLTLGTVAKFSIFHRTVPVDGHKTPVDRTVCQCRDTINAEFLEEGDDCPMMTQFVMNSILFFIIACVTGRSRAWSPLTTEFIAMWNKEKDPPNIESAILLFVAVTAFVSLMPMFCRMNSRKPRWDERRQNNPPWWLCFSCPCSWALISVRKLVMIMAVCAVIAVVSRQYLYEIWQQLGSLQALPEDVVCPMLWKDPLADYVFWLA